ncbi:hypothetical protein M569_05355 [Genlisea aurea]|uniref:S-protein homolog n=1 Tax=Genlisea aurea TaxID=192259 RepID=S8CQI5_9LAMI|nr:hypothetical protein M569_05355 [Genlisea aurea]
MAAFTSVVGRKCWATNKYQVGVMNDLGDPNVLYVQCASKDDHFSNTTVPNAGIFHWSFCDSFTGSTLFWCTLTWNGVSTSFQSFNDFTRARCKRCIWIARTDGVYFSPTFPPAHETWAYAW